MSSTEPLLGWPGWKQLRFAAVVALLGGVWFCLVYGGADALTAHRETRVRVHFDAELGIPFIPEAVVVYMSIYLLFIMAPFIVRTRGEFLFLALALNIMIGVAGIGYLLIPAQLAFPAANPFGAVSSLFRFADRLNLTYNLVPSLHVGLSSGCAMIFARHAGGIGKVLWLTWAAAIALSTLLTHQHHVVDVVTGWLLAWAVYRWYFCRRHKTDGCDGR